MLKYHRLISSIIVLLASALTGSVAFAQGTTFELEDPSSSNIKDDIAAVGPDWASLFDVPGDELAESPSGTDGITPTPKATLPTGVYRAGFYRDFLVGSTADNTTFTTGTKDIQNISGGGLASGEWQCKKKSNVSDKGDVLNAYATIYEHESGDTILAMGIERASDNGTSKVGFWFLQDDTVACDTTGGKAQTFTGNHIDGDLLVIIDFEQGGNNPTAKVYEWQGDATTGALVLINDTGITCTAGTDLTCATTNQSQTLLHSDGNPPWLTQTKTSGPNFSPDLQPLMFFEAQVNLTDEGIQRCFNKFMPNTRQSASVTATVFDYLLGDFNVCSFSANKTCTSVSISASGTQVDYTFSIAAKNTGIAPIDVTATEQTTGCTIGSTNPVKDLAPGATANFTVSCPNKGLAVTNQALVTAKFNGTPIPSKTVTAVSTNFPACVPNPISDINLTSECDKVVLETIGTGPDSRLGLDATIKGLVKAPAAGSGVEALNNVTLNIYNKSCTGDIGGCTAERQISIGQLKPGDNDTSWTHNYDVLFGDNTQDTQCAGSSIFQKRVIAFGTGALSGDTYYSKLVDVAEQGQPPLLVPFADPVDCKPCIDCTDPEPEP